VAISEFNRRYLAARYPDLSDKTVLIRNGLDTAAFSYQPPEPPRGPLRVAAVGRLVEKKGLTHLIQAAGELVAAGVPLQIRIAGDGEQRAELAHQIQAAGLEHTIELLGPRHQAEIRDLLRWADVMAAPCVVGAD